MAAGKSRPRKDEGGCVRVALVVRGKPFKRKSRLLCNDNMREVDYKNVNQLRRYVSEREKIRAPRMTGACRKHQRQIAVAIKRAREMALLPYVAEAGSPLRSRSSERH